MGCVFTFLGLTVGFIAPMGINNGIFGRATTLYSLDNTTKLKQYAYKANVTYVISQELAFDFLRNNLTKYDDLFILEQIMLISNERVKKSSELFYAIVDEIDFVFM